MKNEFTENILREWLNVFKKNFDLINDMPSISENFIGFIQNQHDQSALSLLLKKNGLLDQEILSTFENWYPSKESIKIAHWDIKNLIGKN